MDALFNLTVIIEKDYVFYANIFIVVASQIQKVAITAHSDTGLGARMAHDQHMVSARQIHAAVETTDALSSFVQ